MLPSLFFTSVSEPFVFDFAISNLPYFHSANIAVSYDDLQSVSSVNESRASPTELEAISDTSSIVDAAKAETSCAKVMKKRGRKRKSQVEPAAPSSHGSENKAVQCILFGVRHFIIIITSFAFL